MSQIEVERFLGRIITDADFRARAAGALEKTISSEGFTISNAEMSFLTGIDYALFGLVAVTLNDSIRRN